MIRTTQLLAAAAFAALVATPALAEKSDRVFVDRTAERIALVRAEPGVAQYGGAELDRAQRALHDLYKTLDDNEDEEARSVTNEIDTLIEVARMRARIAALSSGARASARLDTGSSLVLQDMMFETGKAELKAGAVARLRPLIAYLRANPSAGVRIDGHADAQGSASANRALAQRRADAVRERIAAAGVDRARIEAIGHGANQPLASNASAEGRQQNRRVEVTLTGGTDRLAYR